MSRLLLNRLSACSLASCMRTFFFSESLQLMVLHDDILFLIFESILIERLNSAASNTHLHSTQRSKQLVRVARSNATAGWLGLYPPLCRHPRWLDSQLQS